MTRNKLIRLLSAMDRATKIAGWLGGDMDEILYRGLLTERDIMELVRMLGPRLTVPQIQAHMARDAARVAFDALEDERVRAHYASHWDVVA